MKINEIFSTHLVLKKLTDIIEFESLSLCYPSIIEYNIFLESKYPQIQKF